MDQEKFSLMMRNVCHLELLMLKNAKIQRRRKDLFHEKLPDMVMLDYTHFS